MKTIDFVCTLLVSLGLVFLILGFLKILNPGLVFIIGGLVLFVSGFATLMVVINKRL